MAGIPLSSIIGNAVNIAGGVLGSVFYQSAADTSVALAPNITTTRKFFTQTGNGTVGAAPAWNTLAATDMPALTGGDVTSSAGSGNLAIGTNKVTLAQMAQVVTATFLGRTTAATGNVEALTVAQAKTLLALVKADVGLGNVDNTTDAGKPVSTAQQTALNLKANLAGPTLTGIPTAPTAVGGTNTTQLATTAFVTTALSGAVTTISIATANGVSGSSSGGATPALTIALGSITPSDVTVTPTAGNVAVSAVGGFIRVQRSAVSGQYVTVEGGSAGLAGDNYINSYSVTTAAKYLTFGSTTDASHTAPSGGTCGFRGYILGVLSLEITAASFAYLTNKFTVSSVGNGVFLGSITSSVVTGTAPLVVASTTLVANLNVASLNSQSGSYYLDLANATGNLAAARLPAFTGDVTSSAGSSVLNITANAVTLADMATIATASFLGRNTAATGNVEVLSTAQAKTLLALVKADVGLGNVDNTSDATKFANTTLTGTTTAASLDITGGAIRVRNFASLAGDGVAYFGDGATDNYIYKNGSQFTFRFGTLSANLNAGGTIWTSTNGGAASGLDADLLDGVQGSSYLSGTNSTGTSQSEDMNAANKSGFWQSSSGLNGPGVVNWYWYIHHEHTSTGYGFQLANLINNNDDFHLRTRNVTTWQAWRKIWHTGNLTIANYATLASPTFTGTVNSAAIVSSATIVGQRFYTGWDSGIANSFSCNGWFRANGNTGFYCDTWAGGVYMTDVTYLRSYNNKAMLASDFVISSDRRLKTAIRPLVYRGRLSPVQYLYKKDARADFGFIAQDVQELYPEAVGVLEEDGMLQLSYGKLTAILSHQVNAVEDENLALKAEIGDLKDRLSRLEELLLK